MRSWGYMVHMTVEIGSGSPDDLEAISEIYAHYVRTSAISFDVEVPSAAWRREWFSQFDTRGRHRLLVARSRERAVGYAASAPYRPRAAYAPSVETSVYVAPTHIGQGVGSALYAALLDELEREDVHRAYAGIAMPNPASVRLHERCAYRRAGYYTEQGRKFGRYWDVAWFERAFPEVASTTSG
ncbi:MAG TPA: GNAT family N-acetyltransferase [Actinomycetota bacterium]|nr:GNAT family N-acetyltransferase [Actinomycetota bacterium]